MELGLCPMERHVVVEPPWRKLAGLSPSGWVKPLAGRRAAAPGMEQPRSFLGRVLLPRVRRAQQTGLLARLQGSRAQGVRRLERLHAETGLPETGKVGPSPAGITGQRWCHAGGAAPEPPPKVPEPPKVKEPLSGELRPWQT